MFAYFCLLVFLSSYILVYSFWGGRNLLLDDRAHALLAECLWATRSFRSQLLLGKQPSDDVIVWHQLGGGPKHPQLQGIPQSQGWSS